ncbi:hypothetical protein IU449_03775 [Nocardia higoensis]|uniref:Uncharacterized protein n=1 Tax=Nocardia higoensis TaxID=228599 RepID=A0ABS0D5D4_9NOCA|nr:hypothetical protein [Nocardia higoensis]
MTLVEIDDSLFGIGCHACKLPRTTDRRALRPAAFAGHAQSVPDRLHRADPLSQPGLRSLLLSAFLPFGEAGGIRGDLRVQQPGGVLTGEQILIDPVGRRDPSSGTQPMPPSLRAGFRRGWRWKTGENSRSVVAHMELQPNRAITTAIEVSGAVIGGLLE